MLKGLPFNSDYFDEVTATHTLEHIATGEDLFFVISEIYRVLKRKGVLIGIVPRRDSCGAFYPDHKSYWSEEFVKALVNDTYQGANRWSFKILELKRGGNDLFFTLKKE